VSIEWWRDLAVCILCFGGMVVFIFMGIIMLMFYRKAAPILDSVKGTTRSVQNISTCLEEEVVGPLSEIAGIVQGVYQGMGALRGMSRRKRGGRDER